MPKNKQIKTATHHLGIQRLILGLALLALGGATGYTIAREYNRINILEQERLTAQARVVDENVKQQMVALNMALTSIRSDLPYWKMQKYGGTLVNHQLQSMSDAMPGVRTIAVTNADGVISASNRRQIIGLDIHEREYFQAARRGLNQTMLYISPPFKTVLGVYAMNVTKVVNDGRGTFTGIVTATLDPEFFSVLLNSVIYMPGMRASIIHGDGKIFVEVPNRKDLSGMDLAKPYSRYTLHVKSGKTANLFTGGTAFTTGDERMSAWRTFRPAALLMDKPLMISVNRDINGIFALWRKSAFLQAELYGVVVLLAVFSLYFYQRRAHKYDQLAATYTDELEKSEKYIRDITATLGDGLYVLDEEGRLSFMNPEAERLLGWTEEELMFKNIHNFIHSRIMDGASIHSEECEMHKVIRTGKRFFSNDEVFVRRDGSTFPVSIISMPLLDGDRFTASVTLFRDISAQKKAQEQREQMIQELKRALAEIKTLRGIVPICSYCKKVRNDEGYWNQVEQYVSDHTEAQFSHGICPTCFEKEMKGLKA